MAVSLELIKYIVVHELFPGTMKYLKYSIGYTDTGSRIGGRTDHNKVLGIGIVNYPT